MNAIQSHGSREIAYLAPCTFNFYSTVAKPWTNQLQYLNGRTTNQPIISDLSTNPFTTKLNTTNITHNSFNHALLMCF